MIEHGLSSMNMQFFIVKNGRKAWERLLDMDELAQETGVTMRDKVALVVTDLEMPEMAGFVNGKNQARPSL